MSKKSIVIIVILVLILVNIIQYTLVKKNELYTDNQVTTVNELTVQLKQEVEKNIVLQSEMEKILGSNRILNIEKEGFQGDLEGITAQKNELLSYIIEYIEILDYFRSTYPQPVLDENNEQGVLELFRDIVLPFSNVEMEEVTSDNTGRPIDYINKDELIDFFKMCYIYHISIDSSNIVEDNKEYLIRIDSAVLHQFDEFANMSLEVPSPEPILKITYCVMTIGKNSITVKLCL